MVTTKYVFLKCIFSCDVPATSNCYCERALRHKYMYFLCASPSRSHCKAHAWLHPLDPRVLRFWFCSTFILYWACAVSVRVSRDPFLVLWVFYIVLGMRSDSSSPKGFVSGFEGRLVSMRSLSTESQKIRFGLWCTVKWAFVAPVLNLKRSVVGFERFPFEVSFLQRARKCDVCMWARCASGLASPLWALCLGGALNKSRHRVKSTIFETIPVSTHL